jgi:carboxypeptidase D
MRLTSVLSLSALASTALARSPAHVGMRDLMDRVNFPKEARDVPEAEIESRAPKQPLIKQTAKSKKYIVDGKGIPEVDFDVGESYAGLMPISDKADSPELYFWFFPTENEEGKDEITIWLNGGPGCSSLEGFLQENGPFLWQYGTFKPVKNPWTWVKLTNMLWVEQPVGTGFSTGKPTATNEKEVAAQFLGFFKNFIDTFALQGKKIYIAGESYAGYYVPYIADAMLDTKDTKYYDLQGILIYDPSLSYDVIQQQIPAVPFVDEWPKLFNFNESFTKDIHERADKCGYTDFFNKYLSYPPKGPLPTPPEVKKGCDLWSDIFSAVLLTNPCFDIYQVATTCPLLWDVLGFPGSVPYVPEGTGVYFNRKDVQKAINAPVGKWAECSNGVLNKDTSPPSALSVLPGVIERSKRTIIAHGNLDYVLIRDGSLLAIQNMTWGGKQGFQSEPADEFYVPYHKEYKKSTWAASGIMGKAHTERKLTYIEVYLSGHMVPQYQPTAALRQLEFLLGRIGSVSERSNFSFQKGNYGNKCSRRNVLLEARGRMSMVKRMECDM